jgi:hypothetical protein
MGGGTDVIEDESDPAYRAELDAFTSKQATDFLNLAFDFCELIHKDEAEAKDRIGKLERWGLVIDDHNAIECFAMDDAKQDVQALVQELMRLSTATVGEVKKEMASFQPEMDGDAGNQAGDAEKSPDVRGAE